MSTLKDRLLAELEHRNGEVLEYDLNINRFERMIAKIATMPGDAVMQDFGKELTERIATERANLAKSTLTRDTLAEIIEELE